MVVVVRGGPVRRHPVATGLLVGGAVARRGAQKQQAAQQQAQMQQQVAQANANAAAAQKEAEAARKEAEKAKNSQPVYAPVSTGPQMMNVNVVVPAGVQPGMVFAVSHGGKNYNVTCPQGVGPGSTLLIQLPAPQPAVAVAAAPAAPAPAMASYNSGGSAGGYAAAPATMTSYNSGGTPSAPRSLQSHSSSGKDLFREAMVAPPAPPPALSNGNDLVLKTDHFVDENSPQMKQFGIISLSKGTYVTLFEGDLVNGLGGAYADYVKVMVPSQGGRVGMISRHVVERADASSSAPPPPAIGL